MVPSSVCALHLPTGSTSSVSLSESVLLSLLLRDKICSEIAVALVGPHSPMDGRTKTRAAVTETHKTVLMKSVEVNDGVGRGSGAGQVFAKSSRLEWAHKAIDRGQKLQGNAGGVCILTAMSRGEKVGEDAPTGANRL